MKYKTSILPTYYIALFAIFNMFIAVSYAQNNRKVDSLRQEIKNSPMDTTRIKHMIDLAWEYFNFDLNMACKTSLEVIDLSTEQNFTSGLIEGNNLTGNIFCYRSVFDSALIYFNRNIEICKKTNNQRGLSNTYNNMGILFDAKGLTDSAMILFDMTLKIDLQIGDKKSISGTYFGIGNAYLTMGNYKMALENYFHSMRLKDEVGDEPGLAELYISLGNCYYYQKSYDEAMDYYNKSMKIKTKLDDKYGLSSLFINMANIYSDKGDSTLALDFYDKSFVISEQMGNEYFMGIILNNKGKIYFNAGNFQKAFDYSEKSLLLREKNDEKPGVAACLANMGKACIALQKYDEAANYLKRSYEVSKEVNALEFIKLSSEGLSAVYENNKEFELAYKYHLIFKQACDSLQNEANTKEITQMEMQYSFDKKEQKDKFEQMQKDIANQAELKQQKLLRNSFITGFALMLLLALIIFKSYRQKRKDNILLAEQKHEIAEKNEVLNQKNEEITSQRDEIEAQRDNLYEKNTLLFEQKKEITDSINYAKRIQTAILPTGEYANKVLGNHFILFKPKDIVSGDFYWGTRINEWLIVTVADCTGHGVPGAFMSMLGVSLLNEIVRKKEITQASHVLEELRKSIIENLHQKGTSEQQSNQPTDTKGNMKDGMPASQSFTSMKDGMDMVLCAINTNDNFLQFAGANNPLYIVSKNHSLSEEDSTIEGLSEISPDKQPVGIYMNMKPFTNKIIQLNSGDCIYFCSDGFQDQFGGPAGKKFKRKELKKLFVSIADKPMNEQKDILETTFENWKGNSNSYMNDQIRQPYDQVDDVTILGIRIGT